MESVLFGIMLTTSILISNENSEGRKAAKYASSATYRQSGIDKLIEPKLKYLEKRYISEELAQFGVGITTLYRLSTDRKVEIVWSF